MRCWQKSPEPEVVERITIVVFSNNARIGTSELSIYNDW